MLNENKDQSSKKASPYFVDVQNNLLSDLNSRLVIPLTPSKKVNEKVAQKLCLSHTPQGIQITYHDGSVD